MTLSTRAPVALSREALLGSLLQTARLIRQRRCAEITEGCIDGYVALNWMEWHGGGLRLTVTGENICKQLSAGLAEGFDTER